MQLDWLRARRDFLKTNGISLTMQKSSASLAFVDFQTIHLLQLPWDIKVLGTEIDDLSAHLLQLQNSHRGLDLDLDAHDDEIEELRKSLFSKLLEFRALATPERRCAVIGAIQSRIADASNDRPLVKLKLNELSASASASAATNEEEGFIRSMSRSLSRSKSNRTSLKRMVSRVFSSSLSRHDTKSSKDPESPTSPSTSPLVTPPTSPSNLRKRASSFLSPLLTRKDPHPPSLNISILQQYQARVSTLERETMRLRKALIHATPTSDDVWDDSKSVWTQDPWRLACLAQFKGELEVLRGVQACSVHSARMLRKLEARVSALEVDEDDEKVYVVQQLFVPLEKDEIRMSVGDKVTIKMTFVNGEAHGVNLTTGESGMFPIACTTSSPNNLNLDTPLTTPPTPDSPLTDTQIHLPPTPSQKALSSIAEIRAVRRVGYLDRPNTRVVDENWRKLREGWRDAVCVDLDAVDATGVLGEKWRRRVRRGSFWRMIAENYTVGSASVCGSKSEGDEVS